MTKKDKDKLKAKVQEKRPKGAVITDDVRELLRKALNTPPEKKNKPRPKKE